MSPRKWGSSEAELTAARLGHDAVRLSDDARALIAALERVGETKCICRNEYAVHEQVGQFTHQHLSGHAGLVLNPRALDLRLFLSQWASAFHLNDNGRQSIQFFRPPRRRPAESLCDHADRHGGLGDPLIAEYRVAAPAPADPAPAGAGEICRYRRRRRPGERLARDDRRSPVLRSAA
ncbi:hypothetical protein LNQ52_15535 [Klebsiella pneumoniae subsp. pneumoniae]|nr:hypothetical protein [Klebsiella pneumoniae subsp. pneumoniae]